MLSRILPIIILVFSGNLSSCSQFELKKKSRGAGTSDPSPSPGPENSSKVLKLAVKALIVPDQVTFPRQEGEPFFTSEYFLMMHKSGAYVRLHRSEPALNQVTNRNEQGEGYLGYYQFSTDGWVGIKKDKGEFFSPSRQLALEFPMDGEKVTLLGVSPTALVYTLDKNVMVTRVVTDTINSTDWGVAYAPKNHYGVCKVGCDVWSFDGTHLSYGFMGEGFITWKKAKTEWEGLTTEIKKIFFEVETDDKQEPRVTNLLGIDVQGNVFSLNKNATQDPVTLTWPDVLTLGHHYCVECHVADGYEWESTWRNNKAEIMERLGSPQGKTPMPPPGTAQGQQMPASSKEGIIKFLNL